MEPFNPLGEGGRGRGNGYRPGVRVVQVCSARAGGGRWCRHWMQRRGVAAGGGLVRGAAHDGLGLRRVRGWRHARTAMEGGRHDG